ncbi:Uncharacterised protein [Vibrio cholerae]|nr:Uncharacterised protein [Vibrio cholerae]
MRISVSLRATKLASSNFPIRNATSKPSSIKSTR